MVEISKPEIYATDFDDREVPMDVESMEFNLKKQLRRELAKAATKDAERQASRYAREMSTWVLGDQLKPGMVILEHRHGRTYRNKVLDIDPRGRLCRSVKVWVAGGKSRMGWVYHTGDLVEVAA